MTTLPDRLPLFPLKTVLFPGGVLPLRVFEARYMDMITRCMREDAGFGVCLIAAGEEVGETAAKVAENFQSLILETVKRM